MEEEDDERASPKQRSVSECVGLMEEAALRHFVAVSVSPSSRDKRPKW